MTPGPVAIYIHAAMRSFIREKMRRVAEGFRRHGIEPLIVPHPNSDPPPETRAGLHVFFSHKLHRVIAHCRANAVDYICLDHGYAGDRMIWSSMGFNGLNGRADFLNKNSPADRWEKLEAACGPQLQPWRGRPGEDILLTGQVEGDASHTALISDLDAYYAVITQSLARLTGRAVIFRPHPEQLRRTGQTIHLPPLKEQMAGAHCVVTFNSNSAVDAVLMGVPAVVLDQGAMAWDVAGQSLAAAKYPPLPVRIQWVRNLAYAQWHPDEISNGEAWAHLKRRYA